MNVSCPGIACAPKLVLIFQMPNALSNTDIKIHCTLVITPCPYDAYCAVFAGVYVNVCAV